MPSGRTHDRITLWSLPVVVVFSLLVTRSGNLTLIILGGYLFSGLMFGPDLDLHSLPYKRWGWFRWMWIPYQKAMQHRSVFSHGPLIGTVLRVLYLACWLILFGVLILAIIQLFREVPWNWQVFADDIKRSLVQYRWEFLALFAGLELGAMSHSLSDSLGSAYKRYKRHGLKGLRGRRVKVKRRKRKAPSRQRRRS